LSFELIAFAVKLFFLFAKGDAAFSE